MQHLRNKLPRQQQRKIYRDGKGNIVIQFDDSDHRSVVAFKEDFNPYGWRKKKGASQVFYLDWSPEIEKKLRFFGVFWSMDVNLNPVNVTKSVKVEKKV